MSNLGSPPNLRYQIGMSASIFPHDPTKHIEPSDDDTDTECSLLRDERKNDAVMKYARWPLPRAGDGRIRILEITRVIKDNLHHDAQVLLCSLAPPVGETAAPTEVIAKIYDPPCYKHKYFDTFFGKERLRNSNSRAQQEYTNETATYKYLEQSNLQDITAGHVRKYYGSWIMSIPAPPTSPDLGITATERAVCLILIEYLPGATLFDLTYNPKTKCSDFSLRRDGMAWHKHAYPDEWLTHATRRHLEAEARFHQANFSHNDCGSHNIMVVPSPAPAMEELVRQKEGSGSLVNDEPPSQELIGGLPKPRIVIFDFGQAKLDPRTAMADLPRSLLEKYWKYPDESGLDRLVPSW